MVAKLNFKTRIRDFIHSFVYLTRCEEKVINHPLYQRLRFVAHNDISSYIYPSLNTSRFEHSIGTAHVAGKIADSILKGSGSTNFTSACGLKPTSFKQAVRLYALLHDLGHPPLSHLFEAAFTDYMVKKHPETLQQKNIQKWTGNRDFGELHESLSLNFARKIFEDLDDKELNKYREILIPLMGSRKIGSSDPKSIIKKIIASDIDADRIDSITRDGTSAGGEYGNYDIERITTSVRVGYIDGEWVLMFNHKAITALESLLFERFRTFTRIHYHHRGVALKTAAQIVIGKLIDKKKITKKDFSISIANKKLPYKDDVWLWNLIRENGSIGDEIYKIARDALLTRAKHRVNVLWKHPFEYFTHINLLGACFKTLMVDKYKDWDKVIGIEDFAEKKYESELSKYFDNEFGCKVKVYPIRFEPIKDDPILLCNDKDKLLRSPLQKLSPVVQNLSAIWEMGPRFYVVFFGEVPKGRERLSTKLTKKWVDFTANHFANS